MFARHVSMHLRGDRIVKGLVKFAVGQDGLALQEIPEPIPKEGELKVKVLAAGICGSDIHAYFDERYLEMPVVLGHEFVGQVTETCGDTKNIKVGDWVTALPACYSCNECVYCKKGLVTLCRDRRSIGSYDDGAMANYVVVPARYSYKLPETAKTLQEKKLYALAEPFCCIVRGVYERITVHTGDVAVVSGPGPMGLMAAQLLKSRGAYVIVSGLPVDQEKLQLALELGADEVVTSFEMLKRAVYKRNPYGADITCDCTGVAVSLDNCIKIVAPNGVHLQIGCWGGPVEVDLNQLFLKEANYITTNSTATSSWEIGMRLMAEGKVNLAPLMNMEVPLEKWKEGFEAAIHKEKYKIVLLPDNQF